MFILDTTVKRPNRFTSYLDRQLTTSQFSRKEIVDLYVPMVLDQLSIYVIGIISSAMVSASSQEAISATSLVSSIAFMVTALFSAMSTGGSVLVAQAKGRNDSKDIRNTCGQVILITTIIGLLGTGILATFARPIVSTFFADAGETIVEYGITYLKIYGMSFAPFAIYISIFACFRGMGKAKQCLSLTIVINVAHLILSFIFINLMDMGIAGSGWSFVVARVIGAVGALYILFFKNKEDIGLKFLDLFHVTWPFIKKLVRLALPFAIEQILFNAGQLLANTYIAKLPGDAIAANSIALSVNSMLYTTAFATQNLTMTVCGQCIGAKNYDLAKHYTKKFIFFNRFLVAANALVVFPLMPLLMMLYQPSATVEPMVYQLLLIGTVANIFLWSDGYLKPACLRAAGDATFTTVTCMASMWIARVLCGYTMTIVLGWGIHAVWLTYFIDYIIRIVVFSPRLRGEKWHKM